MAQGWKCPRCSTVNDSTGVTCTKCGLFRGSVVLPTTPDSAAPPSTPDLTAPQPPAPDAESTTVPGWTPPDSATAQDQTGTRPIWRRIPIGWLIVGGFLAISAFANWSSGAGRSDSGEINKAGEMAVGDLRVGDCFDVASLEATEVETVTARPCAEEHQFEAFFVGAMPAGDYPDQTAFEEFVTSNCDPAFDAYVGRAFEASRLEVYWFSPNSSGWRRGDRVIQCAVYDPQAEGLTGSLRNADR